MMHKRSYSYPKVTFIDFQKKVHEKGELRWRLTSVWLRDYYNSVVRDPWSPLFIRATINHACLTNRDSSSLIIDPIPTTRVKPNVIYFVETFYVWLHSIAINYFFIFHYEVTLEEINLFKKKLNNVKFVVKRCKKM